MAYSMMTEDPAALSKAIASYEEALEVLNGAEHQEQWDDIIQTVDALKREIKSRSPN